MWAELGHSHFSLENVMWGELGVSTIFLSFVNQEKLFLELLFSNYFSDYGSTKVSL